jgi:hypothetical protein
MTPQREIIAGAMCGRQIREMEDTVRQGFIQRDRPKCCQKNKAFQDSSTDWHGCKLITAKYAKNAKKIAKQDEEDSDLNATLDRCFHTALTADLILDSPRSGNGHSRLRAEPGRGALFEEGLRSQTLMREMLASDVPKPAKGCHRLGRPLTTWLKLRG